MSKRTGRRRKRTDQHQPAGQENRRIVKQLAGREREVVCGKAMEVYRMHVLIERCSNQIILLERQFGELLEAVTGDDKDGLRVDVNEGVVFREISPGQQPTESNQKEVGRV